MVLKMKTSLLINPFTKVAGWEALILGLIAHFLLTGLAFHTGTHLPGYLNFLPAADSDFIFFLREISTHTLVLIVAMGLTGYLTAKSHFRWVDLIGTLLLSQTPLLLLPLLRLLPFFKSFSGNSEVIYLLIFVFIVSIIWTISLSFHAFKISCNPKSNLKVFGFIAAVTTTEIVTIIIQHKLP